jgi:hypothetical protein
MGIDASRLASVEIETDVITVANVRSMIFWDMMTGNFVYKWSYISAILQASHF